MNEDRSELHEGLARLADLAPDGATTARLLEHVPSMVARVRHRRARRRAGTGLAAVGVAAATVGAFTLLGTPPAPVAPATQPSAPSASSVSGPKCGAPFVADGTTASDVGVTVGLDGTVDEPTVSVSVVDPGAEEVAFDGTSDLTVLVLAGGTVVGRLSAPTPLSGDLASDRVDLSVGTSGTLRTCLPGTPDGQLPDGTYTVAGLVRATVRGAPTTLGGTALPMVVAGGVMSTPGFSDTAAQDSARASAAAQDLAAQRAMLAAVENLSTEPFPACGSLVPATSATPTSGSAPLTLTLSDVQLTATPGAAQAVTGSGLLQATAGTVAADVPAVGVIALTKVGSVVAVVAPTTSADGVEIGSDGLDVPLEGTTLLCGSDGATRLPSGVYRAYAVVTVTNAVLPTPDGSTGGPGGPITVVSAPVNVRIP